MHTQPFCDSQYQETRRQHLEETTAVPMSQAGGGGRHTYSIRHRDHWTIVSGHSFREEGLASSPDEQVRCLVILDEITEIESDCSAAWPSPNNISGLSPRPDHLQSSIYCCNYCHAVYSVELPYNEQGSQNAGLGVIDQDLLKHKGILTNTSSMNTLPASIRPACRDHGNSVVNSF